MTHRDELIIKAAMLDEELEDLREQTHRLTIRGRVNIADKARVTHELANTPAEPINYKDV